MSSYMTTPIGSDVYTSDGSKLGTIKEVRDEYFKVGASMQPDYWLSSECIRGGGVSSDRVVVSFGKDRLDDYKVKM